jgi:hypothetical protein
LLGELEDAYFSQSAQLQVLHEFQKAVRSLSGIVMAGIAVTVAWFKPEVLVDEADDFPRVQKALSKRKTPRTSPKGSNGPRTVD